MTLDGKSRAWLHGAAEPLAQIYDVALLDLDGVVYLGPQPIPGVPEALASARELGMRLAFVTNNASRAPSAVAKHLSELGVAATEDDVVTSSQAAVRVLLDRLGPGATVLVTGSPALRDIVEDAGLRAVSSADAKPDAVVQGFWSELRHADLAEATIAVRAGALWVATNNDATMPSPRGVLPGNGSLVQVVARASGRTPVIAGKPELPLHAEGVRRTSAKKPLVVGDRLDTDIEGANAADTPSLLVLTGVTSPVDLLTAAEKHRPTYLGEDLSALLARQPAVDIADGLARCRSWSARLRDGGVEVNGDGPAIDGLRALLGLVWSRADAGLESTGAEAALAKIGLRDGSR